jgi:hypothetical protein
MVDALCMNDLDPYGRELNAPLDELYQDLVHRLFETPGSNIDDVDRGIGIENMLSGGFDASVSGGPAGIVSRRIETDFRKDNRVKDVRADVVQRDDGVYEIAIQVVANETVLGITLEADGTGVRVVS